MGAIKMLSRSGGGGVFQISNTERGLYLESEDIIQEYYPTAANVTAITVRDINTLEYSFDQKNWVSVTLPFVDQSISLTGNVYWRAAFSAGKNTGFIYVNTGELPQYDSCERGIMFVQSGQIAREYHFNSDTVTALIAKDIETLSYSLNGVDYTSVTLPFVDQSIVLNGDVHWLVTLKEGKQDGYLYFQCDNYDTDTNQERAYILNTDRSVVRDFFWNPIKVKSVTSEGLSNIEFSYDKINWESLINNKVLFDNVWFRGSLSGEIGVLSVKGNLDTTVYDAGWLGGQSNALGNAAISGGEYSKINDRIYINGNVVTSRQWEILNPGINDNVIEGQSGPNCGFATEYHKDNPTKFLFYFKLAAGGTSLAAAWLPIATGLYKDYVTDIMFPKLLELVKRKVKFTFTFAHWVQGEADAANQTYADAYFANLGVFFNQLKSDLQSFCSTNNVLYIEPVIILSKPKLGVGQAYINTVRSAMDSFAAIPENNAFTTDADLHKSESGTDVHHTFNELVQMGIDQYNVYKNNL